MNIENRLVDALAEFDQIEPSPDLFARVEESVDRDRIHRSRVRRFALGGLAAVTAVAGFLAIATDAATATISGWAVFVSQLVILSSVVIVLGRLLPRFGQFYVADVFRLDPPTGTRFLRLQDVAYHLVFSGYVLILSWHREMAGPADVTEAIRFLLDRTAGLFLLMGLLHAATLMFLPAIGLVFSTIVREHARAGAGAAAPPEDPRARRAARLGRMMVWIAAGIVSVVVLVGFGLVLGLGISG